MVLIDSIFIGIHTVLSTVGCVANLLVFYLAVFKSPKAIASYTTLIINVAITDFLCCFTDFFIQQRHIPAGFTLAYTSHGFCTKVGPHFCFLIYSINIHFIAHGLWSLLLGFAYRYYILFHPSPSRRTLIFVLMIVYTPSFLQMFIFLWADDDPNELLAILMKKFPDYHLENETVSGTINIINFPALYTIIHMAVPIGPVYVCIGILRKKIINKLMKNSGDMSAKTRELHSQLLRALTYQAMIPAFYSISITSYTIGQFFYNHPIFEYTTLTGFLFMPVLSPISSMVFIQIYRKRVTIWIYKLIRKDIPKEWLMNLNSTTGKGHSAQVGGRSGQISQENTSARKI
ncbi:unnamed protein product [Caenorhabditis angaria]|uniref:G-protein coupled receptors family 1 profile domain-containing protein n=1 Tax=Caenorhabditis angaria TaxID=860376 RepID=A0A9P1IUH6_9PELO|nr:unnamed protein product [Caenorhabditis angaria]